MFQPNERTPIKPGSVLLVLFCGAISLWTAAYPFSRAFLLAPFDYNEGWNVYNAQKVADHHLLYPSASGWTMVNYPALSFHLVAALGRFTQGFIFAGRLLSLAGLCLSGVFAGLIVLRTTRKKTTAWLCGFFVIALFCVMNTPYVGIDDPQILAQAFFLAGIYAYLRGERKGRAIDLAALLFVLGGNIKHNLIEFPLAVLLDLLLTSPRRALRLVVGGSIMALLSIALTIHFDGPAYVACLLAPRRYFPSQLLAGVSRALLTTLLPTIAAFWIARSAWRNEAQRVLVLLFISALAIDTYFSGGDGVDINIFFGYTLAVALLTGVFWARLPELLPVRNAWVNAACAVFFLLLAVVLISRHDASPLRNLKTDRAAAQRFVTEVAYLRDQPDPAICEELLECYYAGKPYLYDPFNAMRSMEQGRLDPTVMVDQVQGGRYGAVQMYSEPARAADGQITGGLFAPSVLQALEQHYEIGLETEDGVIYVPKGRVAAGLKDSAAIPGR